MKQYLWELRRSGLRWWFPLFVALDLAAVFGRSRWWIGVWPQASAAVQIPSLFFAPFLAAGAAWAAGRVSRARFDEQLGTAAIPRWLVEVWPLSAALTTGLGAYAIGAACAAVVSFKEAGPGFLWPGYLLLGASVIISAAAVGHLCGRLFRSPLVTPLVCGLGLFVLLGSAGHRLGFFVLSGGPQERVAVTALAARLLIAIGLSFAAVVVPPLVDTLRSGWFRRPFQLVSVTIAGGILVLGLGGVFLAGPITVPRDAPDHPTCTTSSPKMCFWPEDRKYLPLAETMMKRLTEIPEGLVKYPDTFYERGLRDERSHPSDFEVAEGHPWSISSGLVGPIQEATYPPYCPAITEEAEERRIAARYDIGQWLESRLNGSGQPDTVHGGRPGVDLPAIAHLITQPDSVQAAWATERLRVIRETPCG